VVGFVCAFGSGCARDYDDLFAAPPSGSDAAPSDSGSDGAVSNNNVGDSGVGPQQCSPAGGNVSASCSEGELNRNVHTLPADARLITFSSSDKDDPYDPNCMIIKVGQTVTWRGKLSDHPLIQRESSNLPNPIPTTAQGNEVAVRFDCPGDFNFSCRNHRDAMLGTIRVIP
jgi:plastocyanin